MRGLGGRRVPYGIVDMIVCISMDLILVGYDKYRLDSIVLIANQMISKIRDGSESAQGLTYWARNL